MRKNSNKFDVDINYNPEKTKELQNVLKENWNNFDVDFRIAAVIHDGQWYTLDKIKKVAKVKDIKVVENWKKLLEFDGDEIMIFNPENGKFISIELTEEFMINKEEKGRIKFYELTPSER